MVQLTELAHQIISEHVHEGDTAIDATCGNGYDTYFLCKTVGPSGRVLACDIQADAVLATQQRCMSLDNLTVFQADHAIWLKSLNATIREQVSAVVFNLGYLPGGDKSIVTQSASTSEALMLAWNLLKHHGILSILAYVGHSGGAEEAESVEKKLVEFIDAGSGREIHWPDKLSPLACPRLFIVKKLRSSP